MEGDGNPESWEHGEIVTYFRYIYALFRPGHAVPVFRVHLQEPENLTGWHSDEMKLLIEEGRRQLDRQATDLDQIRSRAQVVITTGIALGAVIGALLSRVANAPVDRGTASFILWALSLIFVFLSALGSAAIVTVRADMGTINATRLTFCEPPIVDQLASAYARTVRVGGNTIATRLTLLRISVLLLLLAASVLAAAWWVMSGL